MERSELPEWLQYLQALATPAIAVVGAAIALGQLKLARYRLQHDLYERRYKIFDGARKFLSELMRDGDCQLEQIFEFVRNTGDAVFLFDSTVTAYLDESRSRAFEIRKAEAIIGAHADPNRAKAIDIKYAQLQWFSEQFPVLVEAFRPFLKLESGSPVKYLAKPFIVRLWSLPNRFFHAALATWTRLKRLINS